jgi:hypothetical protein
MSKKTPLPFANPQVRNPQNGQLSDAEKRFDEQFGNKHNEPVPIVKDDPVWTLANVVGPERADAIEKSGVLSFHTVGDTGFDSYPFDKQTGATRWDTIGRNFQLAENTLVSALTGDVRTDSLIDGPAFLLHLGDVIYFDNFGDLIANCSRSSDSAQTLERKVATSMGRTSAPKCTLGSSKRSPM